ncbi:MAG: bifunctional heptose 7-phosphate kinase/heptose 1-phosphate adenyltransferase [Flavobacteriales bacterium]|jgi:rfaE bifunctional protein kinase chain/domain
MNLEAIFNSFNDMKVAIVGDVMIDSYVMGKVHRMSPEAPVPVLLLDKEDHRLGGAANVALNLKALGAEVYLCSVIGTDTAATKFQNLLSEATIQNQEIIQSEERKTTVKTRVLSGTQHVLRIDQEDTCDLSEPLEDALIQATKHRIDLGIDALIFEDYNKGVLTHRVITELIAYAKEKGVKTTVDPKKDNFLSYRGVNLFKPNLKEIKEGLDINIDVVNQPDSIVHGAKQLRDKLNHELTLITLSEHGVFVENGTTWEIIPAHLREITDVSGAGDTVIAVATLCLIAGLSPTEIAAIANLSGGLVCEHSGVVSVDKVALLNEAQKLVHP